jgi:hypothetical protein
MLHNQCFHIFLEVNDYNYFDIIGVYACECDENLSALWNLLFKVQYQAQT